LTAKKMDVHMLYREHFIGSLDRITLFRVKIWISI